ncbi:FtsK/SpoIIIE domain-containing protein [Streptomyces yunnanensis]|uniref:DNA segregation ATPase FtsK/SpoIIIE, S-DNA-T family n=1 Tax=Streptomyces yunnanensis TaxID=156453 RepID=A0A9X8QRW5_9ACTN|nr:FtsK/SpoIIIE domain-containing protein [Streptomyces yunnanensis]SHL62368.1 DNA segregation ATPase FtsK/SpoIIIE, S-DNA-T family [Streptomyces yunnanensis]
MSTLDLMQGFGPAAIGMGLSVFLVWGLVICVRYVRADKEMRASMRQAARVRRRWTRLAPMAGLSVVDRKPTVMAQISQEFSSDKTRKIEPRTLTPSIKVVPDRFGVVVTAKCLPQVSLKEFQNAADYLADAWDCVRVSVTPANKPGQVVIRGVRRDPLAEMTTHIPTGVAPENITRWHLGLDEYGQPAHAELKEVPGVTVAGLAGYGKTSLINRLICDFAPSPLVQFAVIDGKSRTVEQGDYADVADRLFRFVGDDLDKANAFLKDMVELRDQRLSLARTVFGTNDMWHKGPTATWPIVFLLVDEAHTFFADIKGSDRESKRLSALAAENTRLVGDLVRKGRSAGIITIPITQKATGDAIPTGIRDNCPIGLSFAQRTTEASVAALGENIRQWPDMDPVELQDSTYVGVLVMKAPGRQGFIRVRTPYVSGKDAARIAAANGHLTRDPFRLLADLTGHRITLHKPDPNASGDLAA